MKENDVSQLSSLFLYFYSNKLSSTYHKLLQTIAKLSPAIADENWIIKKWFAVNEFEFDYFFIFFSACIPSALALALAPWSGEFSGFLFLALTVRWLRFEW